MLIYEPLILVLLYQRAKGCSSVRNKLLFTGFKFLGSNAKCKVIAQTPEK